MEYISLFPFYMKRIKTRSLSKTIYLVHNYYRKSGFYSFLVQVLHKSLLPFIIIVSSLFLVDWLWIDLDPIFQDIVDNVHDTLVFALFTVSELFFGIIPPEVFMIWAIKHEPFILYISLLAVLSYLSGIMAYKMGSYIHSFERVKNYIDVRIQKYVKMLKRWGGVLIIAGAILPIPYASVCMAAGLVQYNFRSYLLYGLVRILRYYVYGYILLYII